MKWKVTIFAVTILVILSITLSPSASKTYANDSDEKSNDLSQEVLDKNVDYREKFGLKTDSDFVEGLASENYNKTEQEQPDKELKGQIYLTSQEYDDIKERWSELDKAVDEIREFSDNNWQDKFAGLWVDQEEGGTIHIGVNSPDNEVSEEAKGKIKELYYKPDKVEFYKADFSKDELHDMSKKIYGNRDMLEKEYDINIDSISTDLKNQRLIVRMENSTSDKKQIVKDLYDEDMITFDSPQKGGDDASRTDKQHPLWGGLALSPDCTIGFTAEDRSSSDTYAITAGHCDNTTYSQGGENIGDTVERKNSGSVDAQTISIASSNTSPWVFDGASPHQLKNWEKAGEGYEGQHVTMSGRSGNHHGEVTDTYFNTSINGTSFTNLTAADYSRQGGDSGGTIYNGSTLVGTHKGYKGSQSVYVKVSNIVAEYQIDPVTN